MTSPNNIPGKVHKFGQPSQPVVKAEAPEVEDTVEIGIDDIFNPSDENSDEENIPYLDNQDSLQKEVVPLLVRVTDLPKKNSETEEDDIKPVKKENNHKDSDQLDIKKENKDFKEADNLQTGEQLILNFNKNVDNGKQEEKYCSEANEKEINWADAYRTHEITDCQEELKKVTVIAAPATAAVIQSHEFTKLGPHENICNHCQHIFRNVKVLKRHIRWMHRDVTTMYHCPYCPYKSKWTIKYHIISQHTNAKDIQWFECYMCGRKFKLKTQLTNHILTHLDPAQLGDYMKQCTICSKSFKHSKTLKTHIQFVHNKELHKKTQCQHCEYSSFNTALMKKHIEVHHTTPGERRTHECEKCDFKTTYLYKLKQHKRKHNSSYCCEKCAFVCTSAHRLKLHYVTHQTTIDEETFKYRCDKCDYRTYRIYSLSVHKLNHLKPDEIEYFYCYHCDFKAKRKDNLKTHVLRHFKKEEVDLQCFKCGFSTKKRDLLSDHLQQHQSKAQPQPKDS